MHLWMKGMGQDFEAVNLVLPHFHGSPSHSVLWLSLPAERRTLRVLTAPKVRESHRFDRGPLFLPLQYFLRFLDIYLTIVN